MNSVLPSTQIWFLIGQEGTLWCVTHPGPTVGCNLLEGCLLEFLYHLSPPFTLLFLNCHTVHCDTENWVSVQIIPRDEQRKELEEMDRVDSWDEKRGRDIKGAETSCVLIDFF